MRTWMILAGVVSAGMIAGFCFGQDNQEEMYRPAQLLANLRSDDVATRRRAFQDISCKLDMLRNPKVQSALLDFLDEENRGVEAAVREGERRRAAHERDDSPGPYDDYGFFSNDLLSVIETFVDWHNPRQICLLATAGAALDSPDAHESAERVQVAMPCLQRLSRSDLFMDRLNAVRITVYLLASAGKSLDPDTAEAMRKAIVLALHDKRFEVQLEAVDCLARLGKPDMIPALRELAESDAGHSATDDEMVVRKNAIKAIASIRTGVGHQ